jgi:RNA polymerase sigma-70 factor (ECF subfamily)
MGRLRTLGRRKETYVGPWLPEPLLTSPDVAEDVELADSVSMAMLLVLETLAPGPGACRRAPAARVPIVGADRVARFLAVGLDRIGVASVRPAQVNGYPALIVRFDGEIDTVIAVRIDDGLITGLYAVRNPEKLSHMEQETALRR